MMHPISKRAVLLFLCCLSGLMALGLTATADELRLPRRLAIVPEEAFMKDVSLDRVVIPEGVTQIQARAFANSSVKSIALPGSLVFIADDALSGCKGVTATAPVGSYAYCWAVEHGYIGTGVAPASDFTYTVYNDEATITGYKGSSAVLVIPDKIGQYPVRGIGSSAFEATEGIESVFIPESVTSLGYQAFKSSSVKYVRLSGAIQEIQFQAFMSCASLVAVDIPEGIKTIGDYAFDYCTSLSQITLPKSITQIGSCAFGDCDVLTTLSLPEGVAVQSSAFKSCDSLETVLIAANSSFGNEAFANCNALREVTFAEGAASVGESMFFNCPVLTRVSLASTITTIGKNAFSSCRSLCDVTLPKALTSMGYGAFIGCGFNEIALPAKLNALPERAFSGCSALNNIIIPRTLTKIGRYAFYGCSCNVAFEGALPVIEGDIFSDSSYILARYPHAEPSWTAQARQTYGAAWIHWVADNAADTVVDTPLDASDALVADVTYNDHRIDRADWVDTTNSYLISNPDGSVDRLEFTFNAVLDDTDYHYEDQMLTLERYDSGRTLIWKKNLPVELGIWGGFYAGEKYNFLAFGEENLDEDDAQEVIRIVRYTKNWHRVDSVSLRGMNTVEPFHFGSLRMTQSGDFLYVHTCHKMYAFEYDGVHHQANMSFTVYIPTMEVIHPRYTISNQTYDYVAHSFDQWVLADGEDVIKLDIGDAAPRALTLWRASGAAGSPSEGSGTRLNLLAFGGAVYGSLADNPNAFVGGFEASSTHFLTAGTSIDQENYNDSSQRNVFLIATSKSNFTESGVQVNWFTSYPESEKRYVSTAKLVKISNTRFLLMWTEGEDRYDTGKANELHYVFLNGSGKATTKVYKATASVSDCLPVVSGGKVTWYVTNRSAPVFYSIDLASPYALSVVNTSKGK